MSSFIAAGTAYATHGVNTIPVLHLLLDVRLPARRRPDLGRRRLARARLPARRHRRPDDAGRRRAAAPGRPQPRVLARRCRTACRTTRRTPTSWRSSSRTASAGCIENQESIFYYLTVMNEQYEMPPMPEGARDGILKGLYRFKHRGNPQGEAQGAAARQRRDPERGRSRRRSCSRSTASPPTSGA